MLEKKISGDEMDMLFSEIKEEEEKEEVPVPETSPTIEKIEVVGKEEKKISIRPHNWAQKRRLSLEQMRTLRHIHALFAQQYQSELSTITKLQARIRPNDPEQKSYEEFINSLPNPTYMNKLALPPLEGIAVLQIDLNLALAMIDRNLGGTGGSYLMTAGPDTGASEEIRALSEIEGRVFEHLLEPALTCLRDRWEDMISGVQPTFMGTESIPYFLSLALPEDIVIVLEFDVSLLAEAGRELLNSKIRICYPYMTLQPIVSSLRESRLYELVRGAGPEQRIKLNQVKVPVRCNLVRETLSVEKLLNLKVGDGIKFDVELSQASEVVIGQSRIFWGKPGKFGRKRAVKIESIIKDEVEPIPPVESSVLPEPEMPEIPDDL